MSDLVSRLRGKYSVGPNGVYEDRDFGSFTPKINREAANKIEELEKRIGELENEITLSITAIEWEQPHNALRFLTNVMGKDRCGIQK